MSRENFHRLWDPAHKQKRDDFFKMCEKANDDPVWGKSIAEAIHHFRHDFTQYFNSKQHNGTSNGVNGTNGLAANGEVKHSVASKAAS